MSHKLTYLENLDDISRSYDNIIIVSHCRDELVFFYDFITHRTLLILVTKPSSEREFYLINKFVIMKGCELIILDEPNTFNINFKLSPKTMDILKYYANYSSYDNLITQVFATPESDIVSNQVFMFINKLNLDNHYIPTFNKDNKKDIPDILRNIAILYAKTYLENKEDINKKLLMFLNTYRSVSGLTKI